MPRQTKRDWFGFKGNVITFYSISDLSDALIRAKTGHAEFERGLGSTDHNWPLWYASYIAMEQALVADDQTCNENCGAIEPQTSAPEANGGGSKGLESDQDARPDLSRTFLPAVDRQ